MKRQGPGLALNYSQMNRLPVLIFILIVAGLSQALGNLCVHQVNGREPQFAFHDHRLNMEQFGRKLIGHGQIANVYLYFNKTIDSWRVLKNYKTNPELNLKQDLLSMEYLSGLPLEGLFKIADYQRSQSDNSIEMDYYQGITLEEFLKNPLVSAESKRSVYQKYLKALGKIEDSMIENKFQDIQTVRTARDGKSDNALFALKASMRINREKVQFFIKADNVIVDPFTLELTLIDPH